MDNVPKSPGLSGPLCFTKEEEQRCLPGERRNTGDREQIFQLYLCRKGLSSTCCVYHVLFQAPGCGSEQFSQSRMHLCYLSLVTTGSMAWIKHLCGPQRAIRWMAYRPHKWKNQCIGCGGGGWFLRTAMKEAVTSRNPNLEYKVLEG